MVEGSGLEIPCANQHDSAENAGICGGIDAQEAPFTPCSDDDDGTEVGTGDNLYFIQDGAGPIKIGRGGNARKRLALLQVGNPRPLKLLAEIVGDGCMEPFWHICFSPFRIRGEWFSNEPALLRAIGSVRRGREWVIYTPMIHPAADDEGEWQEHMLDALDAYQDYAWSNPLVKPLKAAALLCVLDNDFDGRCLMSRFADAYQAAKGIDIRANPHD